VAYPHDRPQNAILSTAAAIVDEALARHGFGLAEPVGARFHTADHGSTGVEVSVRLTDPHQAEAAKALIASRFGGDSHADAVIVT
jgi:hypothetical protein